MGNGQRINCMNRGIKCEYEAQYQDFACMRDVDISSLVLCVCVSAEIEDRANGGCVW